MTSAERYLKRLCDTSFLSLWSHPRVFRDQGTAKVAPKEVCDLLVVFEDHIIIFSDKAVTFPGTGDLQRDWDRWFRRAVLASAKQIWGAERWLKQHPNRLFLDAACQQPFPYGLPDRGAARFHRVIVAHGVSARCREALGGSGSLVIDTSIIGDEHQDGLPFHVGQIDPAKGFIHILDDTSLERVLGTLDTISDFTAYLQKKESLIERGVAIIAAGEDDLLGMYLGDINEAGEHDLLVPAGYQAIGVDEGFWQRFANSPERNRQVVANEVSYAWDRLIEKFNHHALTNTQYNPTRVDLKNHERIMRFMAREPRTRRRMLGNAVVELIEKTPSDKVAFRCLLPERPCDPCYAFLLLPVPSFATYEQYREVRPEYLNCYCRVVKHRYSHLTDIIGIATEAGNDPGRSEDVLYLDTRGWTEEDEKDAVQIQQEMGFLRQTKLFTATVKDYPDSVPAYGGVTAVGTPAPRMNGTNRNKPCPCGSGREYKRCCGR